MKPSRVLLCTALLAVALLSSCQPQPADGPFPEAGKVRIIRDSYGVPHIYAADEGDLLYGLGYACASDRPEQIFATVLTTHGRLAELWGEGALQNDLMMRLFRLRPLAEEKTASLENDKLSLLQAYCDGVNAALQERRDTLPEWVTSLEPVDVVAIALMVNIDFALLSRDSPVADMRRSGIGSNQFAVAPQRSASGHAMLSIDPHLMFNGTYRWTEAHLVTEDYQTVGAVIPGLPLVGLGHNGKVAWSTTVNYPDLGDAYAEEINPDNPAQYRGPTGWLDFERWTETFRIKTADGFEEQTRECLASRHGPVVAVAEGKAYAVKIAGLGEIGIIDQYMALARADDVNDVIEAFRTPGFNMQNVVSADTEGNIAYLYNTLCPWRDPGVEWDKVLPPNDPRAEWGKYISFDELPKVVNPESGWLQNCNDSPWYVTENSGIVAEELPNRLCTIDRLGDRGRKLTELLSADDSITYDEMFAYAGDTEVLRARLWVPALLDGYDRFAGRMSLAGTETEEAIELLRGWDYHCDADSTAMALFFTWWERGNFSSIDDASQISDDIKQKQMIELGAAAAELKAAHGRLDVPWGDVLRLRHGDKTWPLSGGGIFSVLRAAYVRRGGDGMYVSQGASYQMVVEMTPVPVARSCFPFGVSEDPSSPHFSDMTELYSRMEYKPVWFTLEDVEANAESTVELEVKSNSEQ